MIRVCSQCLNVKPVFLDKDMSGLPICNDCFGKQYKRKPRLLKPIDPTFMDLKRKWEKR